MPEPRTEWGKELKAQTESLQHDFALLQDEVTSLTVTLRDCKTVVQELTSDLAGLRHFEKQITARMDTVDANVNQLLRFQEGVRIQLSWMKWILGIGASGLIAIGIFIASALINLSSTTAKLEATMQKLQQAGKN